MSIPSDGTLGETVSSRYWRIFVNSIGGSSDSVTIAIIELRDEPRGDNLLVNGTASSSSVLTASFAPRLAFDTSVQSAWAAGSGLSSGEWIAYDLGEGNEISPTELSITARRAGRAPTDFDLQVSEDGLNWTSVRNLESSADWVDREVRNFPALSTFAGEIGVNAITPEQANTLPPNIIPCQMFSLEPKTLRVIKPITLTVSNYDNLPAGAIVDVWVFADGEFTRRGTGSVIADGSKVEASIQDVHCLLYTSPSPRDATLSRMPSSA